MRRGSLWLLGGLGWAFASAAWGQTGVLLSFGWGDKEEQDWSGHVEVVGGRLLALEGWRFEEKDEVRPQQGAWRCRSHALSLNPQLAKGVPSEHPFRILPVGVLLSIEEKGDTRLQVSTEQGQFQVFLRELPWGRTLDVLQGRARVERVPLGQPVPRVKEHQDEPALLLTPEGVWVAWVGYENRAEQIYLARSSSGRWEGPWPATSRPGAYAFPTLARDGRGRMWVAWAAREGDNWDLYARMFDGRRWSLPQRLTDTPQPDLFPSLLSDGRGGLWLIWQGFTEGEADVWARHGEGGRWGPPFRVSIPGANDWEPAAAVDRNGTLWVAWDTYERGNYDIRLRAFREGRWQPIVEVTHHPRFEARPSVACDAQGRVWLAWEESGVHWGKDTGAEVKRGTGTAVYASRRLRVACLENGVLLQPAADLYAALPKEFGRYSQQPQLVADERGRIWLVFRRRWSKTKATSGQWTWSVWELYALCFQGRAWSNPIPLPFTGGYNGAPFRAAADEEGLWVVASEDARPWTSLIPQQNGLMLLRVNGKEAPLPTPEPLRLVAYRTPSWEPQEVLLATMEPPNLMVRWPQLVADDAPSPHPQEEEDLERIRRYRVEVGSRRYRIFRGDLHRHTDVSWDGANDGSLLDNYRYAIDAARLDFLGITDHSNAGAAQEFPWWRSQKWVDFFALPPRFLSLYSYERSIGFPNGHRNIIFAQRGVFPFPISPEEQKAQEGAAKLFAHLRASGGLSTPHTSATGMGTDWRDNDPWAEPFVEIFQGCRNNYEHRDAPEAPQSLGPQERFAAGFVWNAWAKGYRLGVQASSDHVSTHLSYACLFAEEFTREALLEAMRARRTYAATDNIVLDVRLVGKDEEFLMGSEVSGADPPLLRIHIEATAPIHRVDIIRNEEYVYTYPATPDRVLDLTYRDQAPPRSAYYYIRVWQENSQYAWSSPLWVRQR